MSTQPRPLIARRVDAWLVRTGRAATFTARFLPAVLRPPFHVEEVVRQCFEVGVRTLPLITLTGFVTGVVFTTQSRPSLASFGATSWLPSLITIAIVRSLAPLVTALVCAGRVGSSIGAELGSMRVTEQIEAMEVSAVDPYKYLVSTRTLATTLMSPVLTMYFGVIGLFGAFLNVKAYEGTTWAAFVRDGFSTLELLDVTSAVVKSVVYGFTIGIIACSAGFTATGGTQGVGRAANRAVVLSMLAVFLEEIAIVQVVSFIRGD